MDATITQDGKYQTAKQQPKGASVECPQCGQIFVKASYQQAFCSNAGAGNCKDAYWNSRGPRARQKQVGPAVDGLVQILREAAPFVQAEVNRLMLREGEVAQVGGACDVLAVRNEREVAERLLQRIVEVVR